GPASRPPPAAPRRSARRTRPPCVPVPGLDNRGCRRTAPRPPHGAKTGSLRGSKSDSWSSTGIGVIADTLFAFANRVVARDRIERREHRLDRRLALHGRNHEALFEGRQRGEPPDRLYLGRISLAFGERPFHLFRRYIPLDLLRAHEYAHRDQLAIDLADDLFVAPRQQARHIAQRD